MVSTHYKEVYDCGHVGAQCRCPGPKTIRYIRRMCDVCVARGFSFSVYRAPSKKPHLRSGPAQVG